MNEVVIETPAGRCDAHVFGRGAGVILFMDVFGPRPRLFEMAETIAARGHRVLVPNLFYRQARPPYADPMALLKNHAGDNSVVDGAAFLDVFENERVRLVGYCMGGGVAIRVAAAYPDRVACAAAFHPARLATDQPDSPHLLVKKIKAELYLGYADRDPTMPPAAQDTFARALDGAGVTYRAEVYENAEHGFTMSDRPAYDEAATERAWRETFALFARAQ